MNRVRHALLRVVSRHRLVFAVTAVVVIALLSTVISMSLYISSGASSLDLSRPGYSQARSEVKNVPSESFSSTGDLDQKAFSQFEKAFTARRAQIDGSGDFKDASLDDASLLFNAP